jgi:hypothetical protein
MMVIMAYLIVHSPIWVVSVKFRFLPNWATHDLCHPQMGQYDMVWHAMDVRRC